MRTLIRSLPRRSWLALVLVTSACYGMGSHDGQSGGVTPWDLPSSSRTPSAASQVDGSAPLTPHAASAQGDASMQGMVTSSTAQADAFDSPAAHDDNAASNVVEISLEARETDVEVTPGHVVHLWTYNGVLPGPRIEANVGDRVIVHLKNSLPESTTVHWHGLRVPAAMDGSPMVQMPIEPGTTFTYDFVVPDAGTFWYHPHVRSNEQVERGLYGSIVVRGQNEPRTTSEHVVVLDDMLLDDSWQLAPFEDPRAMSMQTMVGREGNVILANGRTKPVLSVARGGRHRFRFVNAANARYFRLAVPGQKLTVIGSSGGLMATSYEVSDVLLVPGQRVDLLVQVDGYNDVSFESLPYNRGHMAGTSSTFPLFALHPSGQAPEVLATPTSLGDVPTLSAPSVTRTLKLGESMMGGMGGMAGMGGMGGMGHMGHRTATATATASSTSGMFTINGEAYPNVTPLVAKLGAVEDWALVNTSMMDHPFHLHGFRFQVVSRQDGFPLLSAWEDTVNVKANQTVTVRMRLEDHAGSWMFHCHILEHAEAGMMGELNVTP